LAMMAGSTPALSQPSTQGPQSPAIVAGHDVNVTYGLTPEQVQAAIAGVTGQLVEVSTKLGITQSAALTLLRVLGEQNVPLERLPEKLDEITARYKQAVERLATIDVQDDPVTGALVERAQAAIKDGRLDKADQLLSQAEQVEIAAAHQARQIANQAQAAADRRYLHAAAASASRGDIAMTQVNYPAAAAYFQEAVDLVPAGHPDERGRFLLSKANALLTQGDERGDNPALVEAIATCQFALQENTRQRVPLEWARTQVDLGAALERLGERESDTAHLQQAVDAFTLALQENTRQGVPLEWARTQLDLGVALEALGRRTDDSHLLQRALICAKDAEAVFRSAGMTDWAERASQMADDLRSEIAGDRTANSKPRQE